MPGHFESCPTRTCNQIDFIEPFEADKPAEECGVVGILIVGKYDGEIAEVVRTGLQILQHRGQEAAGVAVTGFDGSIMTLKDTGLVSEALGGNNLVGLPPGHIANGHVRYSTSHTQTKKEAYEAAGPGQAATRYNVADPGEPEIIQEGSVSLSLNGHIINKDEICRHFGLDPVVHKTDAQTVTAAVAAARTTAPSLHLAVASVFSMAKGAFSITVMGEGQLIGLRDPHGFRPLMLGTYPDNGGYVIASETPAVEAMAADCRREIARGEMIVCRLDGSLECYYPFEEKPSRLCALEKIYLASPLGELMGREVYVERKRLGEELAREHLVDVDKIIGLPDSGIPASEGYAMASGIPHATGFQVARYGYRRNFIVPGQAAREYSTTKKLNVIRSEVNGQRLGVVDDTIVRGTTLKHNVSLLWQAGAAEIHLLIPSPPIMHPCFYGLDIPTPGELIANRLKTLAELEDYFGVNSIAYLSIEGLRKAIGDAVPIHCLACMNAEYATEVPYDSLNP